MLFQVSELRFTMMAQFHVLSNGIRQWLTVGKLMIRVSHFSKAGAYYTSNHKRHILLSPVPVKIHVTSKLFHTTTVAFYFDHALKL